MKLYILFCIVAFILIYIQTSEATETCGFTSVCSGCTSCSGTNCGCPGQCASNGNSVVNGVPCAGTTYTIVQGFSVGTPWWCLSSTSTQFTVSSEFMTSTTCGSDVVGGTNSVIFPKYGGTNNLTCTVSVRVDYCGGCFADVTSTFLRGGLSVCNTCGDGYKFGTEQCDAGTDNGKDGSCCSNTCTLLTNFSAGTPSTQFISNSSFPQTLSLANWFPSVTVNSSYWYNASITFENCTGSPYLNGTADLTTATVVFNQSIGQQCYVSITVADECQQAITQTAKVVVMYCGDGIVNDVITMPLHYPLQHGLHPLP